MAKKKKSDEVVEELGQATEQKSEADQEEVVVESKAKPAAKTRYVLEKDYEGYIGRNVKIKAGEEARGSVLRQLQKENHPLKEMKA